MEVRGLGIINVRELFGAASVCESKEIELIVDLIDWRPDLEFDRLGLDENTLPDPGDRSTKSSNPNSS